jgi:hypothetical protein
VPESISARETAINDSRADSRNAASLRGTQSLVGQMGWVFARPSLTLMEVAWRWLFGIPMLVACWIVAQRILTELPLENAGVTNINFQNPWIAAVRLADAWTLYRPHVAALLPLVAVPAAVAWAVISGIGRNLVLRRMERSLPFRPLAQILLQAAWLGLLIAICWGWFVSIGWAAKTHITPNAEPDLVGYFVWAIFLSLGFFTLWALVSWVLSIAPLLVLLEERSALSSLGRSLRLGRPFTSKLVEINLVMGIVKLMLIVLAMVFSSVLIPFADEVGASALHLEWVIVSVFYFVASDYFQVVRLKGFLEFWHAYRAPGRPIKTPSD